MPRDVAVQPPLVTTLFAPTYFQILDKYPIARHAGAEVRRAIAVAATSNDSFAVEKFIRDTYENASNPSDKRKALALPWYLQELLWAASRFYTKNPDNYDVLVSETLRLGDVIFVTLNYDVILDSVLETYSRLKDIDDYVRPERPWDLIKLHGSVSWAREIERDVFQGQFITEPPVDLFKKVNPTIEVRPVTDNLEELRLQAVPARYFYPALSVPIGGDEGLLNCPPGHVTYLRERLAAAEAVDLLVIGYSANDQEVLALLAGSETTVGTAWIVADTDDNAEAAMNRISAVVPLPALATAASGGGFTHFAQTSAVTEFLQVVARQRSSAHSS